MTQFRDPTQLQLKPHVQRMIDVLECDGWCQGHMTDRDGAHCLLGALERVESEPLRLNVAVLLRRHLRTDSLARWNDAEGRTKDAVLARLRELL